MCNYKIYHQSESGYVARCRCCGHFQLAFGTVAITLTPNQFDTLATTVEEYRCAYLHETFREQKIMRIPTPSSTIWLALCVNEIEKLSLMLEETLVLVQTDALLAS